MAILAFKDMTPEAQLDRLEKLLPLMVRNNQELDIGLYSVRRSQEALRSKNPTVEDLFYRIEAKKLVSGTQDYLKQQFAGLDLERTFKSLERACSEKLLQIHSFTTLDNAYIAGKTLQGKIDEHIEKFTEEFVDTVLKTISDGSTYPLFDDATGRIVRTCVDAGVLSASHTRVAQGKQSQLAAELLGRLPLFDIASVDEILDIRRELERHLIRFRSAIMKYAEKIRSASWDEEFSAEATEILHRDIEPAVLDIEDAVKSNNWFLSLTTRKLVDKPAIGTSIFSFVVAQLSSLPTITTIAMAAATGATTAIYDAYKESQRRQQIVEQNQLYFYYRAGQLIYDRTYEYS